MNGLHDFTCIFPRSRHRQASAFDIFEVAAPVFYGQQATTLSEERQANAVVTFDSSVTTASLNWMKAPYDHLTSVLCPCGLHG